MDLGNLLLGQVSRVPILRLGCRMREIIVVVFRVEIHGGVWNSKGGGVGCLVSMIEG